MDGKALRNSMMKFFRTPEFEQTYQQLAVVVCEHTGIPVDKFIIQSQPTPRVYGPGDHGTSWHADYWYGHGESFFTIWVPLVGAIEGATFEVVKNVEDSERLMEYYASNSDLLAGDFDLKGAETFKVVPPENTVAMFSAKHLHGSTQNTTSSLRLSFDFRFGSIDDTTSTKQLDTYLKIDGDKLVPVFTKPEGAFLKYIRGGCGISTMAQHILVEGCCEHHAINITGQEAEIERFGQPMFRKHISEIKAKESQFDGVVLASKKLIDDENMALIPFKDVPVFCALENEFLS